jgi:hypothetical protein
MRGDENSISRSQVVGVLTDMAAVDVVCNDDVIIGDHGL